MPNVPAATTDLLAGIGLIPDEPEDVPVTDPGVPTPEPAAPAAPADPPAPAGEPEPDPTGANNPDAYQKAIAAERKKAKDANAAARALQAKLEEQENASKPLQQQIDEANAKGREAALIAVRYEVAAKVGLDLTLASRLSGTTREEIEADAETFKTQVGAPAPTPTIPPEGGVRTTPEAKADPAKGHNNLILELLNSRTGTTASGPSILAGLEPAPAD